LFNSILGNLNIKRNLSRGLPKLNITPEKLYINALDQKIQIIKENSNKSFVYRWTNKINGKTYLGSTANSKKRLNFYFDKGSLLTKKIPIYMALLKYGHANFTFEIIKYCEPKEAVIFEQTYLDNYDFDYNINVKANSILGYKHTAETLNKMKGRQNFKGKTHNEENKQKIRDLAAEKRKNKQIHNKIKLSYLFDNVSSYGKVFCLGNPRYKKLKVIDVLNNQSIVFNSLNVAASILCTSSGTLLSYAKTGNLFSYFELDTLNNSLIERKLLLICKENF